MLGFILLKIKNKYKLYSCLFLGLIFMLAVFSLISFYGNGAMEKLINDGFYESYEKNESFPFVLSRNDIVKADKLSNIKETVKSYENSWNKYLGCPSLASEYIYTLKGCPIELSYKDKGGYLDISYIEGGELETVYGAGFETFDENADKEIYPCVIDQGLMDFYNLVVGEEIVFTNIKDDKGNALVFRIEGIVREKSFEDYVWYKSLSEISLTVYTDEANFDAVARRFNFNSVTCENYELVDYRYVNPKNADEILDYLNQFHERDEKLWENASEVLKQYIISRKNIKTILYVIAVPLLFLLIIFISMISSRIIDSEKTELASLHSRGLSSFEILKIYIIQTVILEAIAYVFGILLGYGLYGFAKRVDGFLSVSKDIRTVDYFNAEVFLYAGVGVLLSAILQLIPVVMSYKDTVISLKSKKIARFKGSFWERYFLDIPLMIFAIYMVYNFNKQLDTLRHDTLVGKGLDPMIFLSATVFMMALGLIFIRLINYLLRGIYKVLNKRLKPAGFAALLYVIRNKKKSNIISIFMVVTIASSIFNANIARTVNENIRERINYNVGTDLVYKEKWNIKLSGMVPPLSWRYEEPDYEVFGNLNKNGYADSVTRVIKDEKAGAVIGAKKLEGVCMLGINTKEFGETAQLKSGLNDVHWYNYLNNLAVKTNGVIISKNLAEYYEVGEGDTIGCFRYPPPEAKDKESYATAHYEIVGIVDAFPGFVQYETYVDEEGNIKEKENYLMVINYANAISTYGITPYEVWISCEDADSAKNYIKSRFSEDERRAEYYVSREEEISDMNSRAVIQITNGLFTINFILSILFSVLGFLLYQITELRDRQGIFGVYRAMGISMHEINRMLLIEVSGVLFSGIAAGALSGILTTKLFIKIFAAVYLPQKHNIPVGIFIDVWDYIRLGIVLVLTFAVCFMIIRSIVKRLKITEVIKLGED